MEKIVKVSQGNSSVVFHVNNSSISTSRVSLQLVSKNPGELAVALSGGPFPVLLLVIMFFPERICIWGLLSNLMMGLWKLMSYWNVSCLISVVTQ